MLNRPMTTALHLAGLFSLLLLVACKDPASAPESSPASPEATPVAAFQVEQRNLARNLQLSGQIESNRKVRIHARATGVLKELHVDTGDDVSQGQSLAQLDLAETQAELQRAQAVQEEADFRYQRAARLHQQQAVSEAEYQEARRALRVAESERQLWQTRAAFADITSPLQGRVSERLVEPGELVQDEQQILTLISSQLQVRVQVPETTVNQLLLGQQISLELDAFPGQPLIGQLQQIYPTADPSSRQVPLIIRLPEEALSQGVRPGYLARLSLSVDQRKAALAIPTTALAGTPASGERYVYRINSDQQLERQAVTPGITLGRWVEITQGLNPGDLLVASNPADRHEGEQVYIQERR